ncbi:hypothetical protein KY310_04025 [Candidatus Woesearchaeota archaeon]|nr:hypothetical protein [Candidatus Woesearchaeota archaeon]
MRKILLTTLVLACLAVLVGCMTGEAIRGPQGYPARDDIAYRPAYEQPVQMIPTPTPAPVCCELRCETVCGSSGDPAVSNCFASGGRAMQWGFEFTCCYEGNKPTSEYTWTSCLKNGGQPLSMRVQ